MLSAWNKNGWRPWHLYAAIGLVLAAVLVHLQAWMDIFELAWRDEECSHIFLVPIVIAPLIHIRRRRFRKCQPTGTWIGPVLVILGCLLGYLGYEWGTWSFFHGGAVLTLIGALLTVLGKDILLRFLPAFVVLIFLIPVPGRIRQGVAIPLQQATAAITQQVFDLIGTPIERSGNQLSINGQAVNVVEACNGIRMVFALTLVCYTFAFCVPLRGYVRVIVLASSPITAILFNVIRMVPTVYAYGYFSQDVAKTFHDLAGWAMLPPAFLMLLGIIRLLRWARLPVAPYTLAYD